jgi:hypothetical protein
LSYGFFDPRGKARHGWAILGQYVKYFDTVFIGGYSVRLPVATWPDLLEAGGYRPQLTDEGEVSFHHEGRACFIVLDPQAPGSARLVSPIYWPVDGETALLRAFSVASYASTVSGAAKVCLLDPPTKDGALMGAVVEFTDVRPRAVRAVLPARLADLQCAVSCYIDEMRTAQEALEADDSAAAEAVAEATSADLVGAGAGERA